MNKCQQEFERWVAEHENTIDSFNYPDEALEVAFYAGWEAAQKCEWGDIRTVRMKADGVIIDPRKKN